ncbi:MAG: hypothetical protein HFF90_11095 [Oscillibacter sp.]|nr:hypothetical protein [Oscillibacter sp.]
MIDQKLYCETFSRLRASDEAKKEVLMKMQEKKNGKSLGKILRGTLIAAALTVALAVTVNAASGGSLLDGIVMTIVATNGIHQTMVDGAGNEYDLISIGGGTEIRDGRVILMALGEEEDITDALEQDGKFTKTYDADGMEVTVNVTGTPKDHEVEIVTPNVTITQADPSHPVKPLPEGSEVGFAASEPVGCVEIPSSELKTAQ